MRLRFKDCAYCCIASKISEEDESNNLLFSHSQLCLLLGPHRQSVESEMRLLSSHSLPVNMVKCMPNDRASHLRLCNCTKETKLSCSVKSRSVFLSHIWMQKHVSLFPLAHSQSQTATKSFSILVCSNLVCPACHSCHVFLLLVYAHTASYSGFKINKEKRTM